MARFICTPKVDMLRPSDAIARVASITAMSADTDMRAISGKPRFCPQQTLLIGGAATADAVLVTEDDETLTISVPANGVIPLTRPIKTLVKTGSGAVQVLSEYWEPPSSQARNL